MAESGQIPMICWNSYKEYNKSLKLQYYIPVCCLLLYKDCGYKSSQITIFFGNKCWWKTPAGLVNSHSAWQRKDTESNVRIVLACHIMQMFTMQNILFLQAVTIFQLSSCYILPNVFLMSQMIKKTLLSLTWQLYCNEGNAILIYAIRSKLWSEAVIHVTRKSALIRLWQMTFGYKSCKTPLLICVGTSLW